MKKVVKNSKNEWKNDVINVEKLELDLKNPRLPKHISDQNDITEVRKYLLEKEGVLRIARSIANNGYHQSAVAIVYNENGRTIVLDGNRRLAACQCLLKPELAIKNSDKKEFERLSKITNKQDLKKIKIAIAPFRKEAEKEIWDIHVNPLHKKWEVLQKLRMYRNLIDSGEHDIKSASSAYDLSPAQFEKELASLFFYEKILEQVNTARDEKELLNSGFNKIDRLILSRNGKKLLGYSIDEKGDVVFADKKTSDENLKKLIPYIINPSKISAQAIQSVLEKNVFSVIDPKKFPIRKEEQKKEKSAMKRKTARERRSIQIFFGGNLKLEKGEVNNIYRDVLDLYDFYTEDRCREKPKLSKNFPALIRMALRLLVEAAALKRRGLKEYVDTHFVAAKNELTQDQKTTLANYSIDSSKKLTQLLQSGAHNYTNSANLEQTVAMSIIIGAMLNITHSKK